MLLARFSLIVVLALLPTSNTFGDLVFTTGTNDAIDLDFDGVGTETNGDLGFVSRTFVLTAGDLASDPEFSDFTSVTIEFLAAGGTFSAGSAAGAVSGGIGVASVGEGFNSGRRLTVDTAEEITIHISSTSNDPSKQVRLSGLGFSSWRGAFPVSQVEFSGAMVDGQTFYTGESGGGITTFDFPVNDVSFQAVSNRAGGGGDNFGLHQLSLSVSSVPEPSSITLAGLLLTGSILRRNRTRGGS